MPLPKTLAWTLTVSLGLAAAAGAGELVLDLGRGPVTVHVPASYDPATPAPLVMLLHGYTSSGQEVEDYIQLLPLSEQRGFLYVFPDGTVDIFGQPFWNATDACCDLAGSGVDDSGYLRSLLDATAAQLTVDQERVLVLGHSNGGFMAYRMACDHADVVSTVVSLAGATFANPADCTPSEPVRVLQIHGTADEVISYGGGFITATYPGAVETTEQWATANGCTATATTSLPRLDLDASLPGAETSVVRYADGCAPGGSAELWTLEGGAHVPVLSSGFVDPLLLSFLFADSPAVFADGFESGDLAAWAP